MNAERFLTHTPPGTQNGPLYLFGLGGAGPGHGRHLGGLELPAAAVDGLLPVHRLNVVVQLCFALKLDVAAGAACLGGGGGGRGGRGGG